MKYMMTKQLTSAKFALEEMRRNKQHPKNMCQLGINIVI